MPRILLNRVIIHCTRLNLGVILGVIGVRGTDGLATDTSTRVGTVSNSVGGVVNTVWYSTDIGAGTGGAGATGGEVVLYSAAPELTIDEHDEGDDDEQPNQPMERSSCHQPQ